MTRFLHVLSGLVIGSVVGAGLGLLFVPRSGAGTRQLIRGRVEAIVEEGRQAAAARQHELTARLENLKQPAPTSQDSLKVQ